MNKISKENMERFIKLFHEDPVPFDDMATGRACDKK